MALSVDAGSSQLQHIRQHLAPGVVQLWLHRPVPVLPRRAQQSPLARVLLRQALAANGHQLAPAQLALPGLDLMAELQRSAGLGLSIAHCAQLLVIALGPPGLGVDCEHGGRQRRWLELAEQFYLPEEAALLRGLPVIAQRREFLRYWTLKEAYIKANNGSLFSGLGQLLVIDGQRVQLQATETRGHWRSWQGTVAGCELALLSPQQLALQLQCFDCPQPEVGGYRRCDPEVVGAELPVAVKS